MQDVLIIGGGVAGLINSILLVNNGWNVTLVEKNIYPFHRVCGEYISNEVVPFLKRIGCYPSELTPTSINRFLLSSPNGNFLEIPLDPGGFGISRFAFDAWLSNRAKQKGVTVLEGTKVNSVSFQNNEFSVTLSNQTTITAAIVLGCQGKRATIDKMMQRDFLNKRSPYIAVKYHMSLDFPDDLIALHNFQGGYCGISKAENNVVNLAYLCLRKYLRKAGNIPTLEKEVLRKNHHLDQLFSRAKPLFEKPMVINEISFATKQPVENHVLMAGDAAGMITPLCGNGMALAIRGAKTCSDLVHDFLNGQINRQTLESRYYKQWHKLFAGRLRLGRLLQNLFGNRFSPNLTITAANIFPSIGRYLIRQSHGDAF